MRKDGLSQDGSFLAAKIENEGKREVLEQTCTIDLKTIFGSVQVRYTKAFRRFLIQYDRYRIIWRRSYRRSYRSIKANKGDKGDKGDIKEIYSLYYRSPRGKRL